MSALLGVLHSETRHNLNKGVKNLRLKKNPYGQRNLTTRKGAQRRTLH